jgi:L-lactate dehydrogenase
MKVGIIGVGAVGTSCAKAMLLRGSCHEIVLLEKDDEASRKRAEGVALDLSHGGVLCPGATIRDGRYEDLANSDVVVITAGINEKTGKAIDRNDPRGRLLLLEDNTEIYNEIVPQLVRVAPTATILVVTDPPDPLADVARELSVKNGGKNLVVSSGTYLDTLRFRLQIARKLDCDPNSVDAMVIGEHGTSQVYVWSSSQIGGESVLSYAARKHAGVADFTVDKFKSEIEANVKFANIKIIEGTGASQHGIGIATARLVEAMLRDEGRIFPVGVFQEEFSLTLSLPVAVGRGWVSKPFVPALSEAETAGLAASAEAIRQAKAGWK